MAVLLARPDHASPVDGGASAAAGGSSRERMVVERRVWCVLWAKVLVHESSNMASGHSSVPGVYGFIRSVTLVKWQQRANSVHARTGNDGASLTIRTRYRYEIEARPMARRIDNYVSGKFVATCVTHLAINVAYQREERERELEIADVEKEYNCQNVALKQGCSGYQEQNRP